MKKIPFSNEEIISMKFGLLTVVDVSESRGAHDMLRCSCDCGGQTESRKSDVVRGHTLSCGCIARKKRKKIAAKEGVIWNPERRKFAAYADGELLGYFYEETIAEMVVNKANRRAA